MKRYLALLFLLTIAVALRYTQQHAGITTDSLHLNSIEPSVIAPIPKPTESPKPVDAGKPADKGKPQDKGKPADTGKPANIAQTPSTGKPEDKTKPVDAAKPTDAKKPTDAGKPTETSKPADSKKPDDKGKPTNPGNKDGKVADPDPGVKSDKVTDYPVNCNSKGRCWQWCGDNDKLSAAKNDFHKQTDGKWCYTTVENTCKTRDDCKNQTKCVDNCEARWG